MSHPNDYRQNSDLIPLDVAARLLMISADRIRQLSKAGYITIPKRGHTTIVSAVQGYIRFLKEDARKETKTAAASRVTDARTAEIELRIAERKRELIPLEDAILAMDLFVGLTIKELVGLPAQITRDMKLRRDIEAKIDGARTRIADALASGKGFCRTGKFAEGEVAE